MQRQIQTLAIVLSLLCFSVPSAGQGWSPPLSTNTSVTLNGLFSVSSTMTIAVGNNGTIIGSSDGGNTWLTGASGTTNHLHKVFVSGLSLPTITVVGDNGTILRSTNGGFTWQPLTSGVNLDLLDIFVHDPTVGTTLTAVGESGVILWTNSGGTNWLMRLSPTPKTLNGVFFKNMVDGYAVGIDGTIISTTDGGVNWQAVTNPATANLNHIFFTTTDVGWIVGDGGTMLKTTDGGGSWSALTSPTSQNLRRIMFTDINTGTMVGDNGVIFRTTDAGATWNQQASGTTRNLTSVFFVDANNGMATGAQGLVISTWNGGWPVELSSFSATAHDDGSVALRWVTESETQNFGFDIERDAGTGWETAGFVEGNGDSKIARHYSFVDRPATDAKILRYRLRQRDFDGGCEYSPEITVERDAHPADLALSAWPNPFTPATNLQLTLPARAAVRLRIHGMDGRVVATLQDG
ncbi:MAG: hypothetical protein IH600_08535, partial [Bacteroidetes bacterium]|nr:hypothetical protein [Bacteroidota bacterium]